MELKWKFIFLTLVLIASVVWLAAITTPGKDELHLIACDVGQGDAILATLSETQILVDGGPSSAVTTCLSNNMPFFDRNIELVILSHPQTDHYRGLVDVFENYTVNYLLATGLDSDAKQYTKLKEAISANGTKLVSPDSGKRVRVGEMVAEVVHPSQAFMASESSDYALTENGEIQVLGSFTTKRNPNDFSVVVNLSFGEFDALLAGDIGPEVVDEVITTGYVNDIEYLKVPHHGSKNGLTKELLDASTPELAVISVGKNQWGHPHGEVLEMLSSQGIRILRTDVGGDVVVVSDGVSWWVE